MVCYFVSSREGAEEGTLTLQSVEREIVKDRMLRGRLGVCSFLIQLGMYSQFFMMHNYEWLKVKCGIGREEKKEKKLYYRLVERTPELYKQVRGIVEKVVEDDKYLKQLQHEYSTQGNESFNFWIASLVLKTKHLCSTTAEATAIRAPCTTTRRAALACCN